MSEQIKKVQHQNRNQCLPFADKTYIVTATGKQLPVSPETSVSSGYDGSLDDTLPVDSSEIPDDNMDTDSAAVSHTAQPQPTLSTEFKPDIARCSTAVKSEVVQIGSSMSKFQPLLWSTALKPVSSSQEKVEMMMVSDVETNPQADLKVAPIFKLPQPSQVFGAKLKSDSFAFKPTYCSTLLKGSTTDAPAHASQIRMNSDASVFNPLFSSTRVRMQSDFSNFNPPRSSTGLRAGSDMSEFNPIRTSTGLKERDEFLAFVPARCSTGLSESSTFCPPISSTAMDDSNIPNFKKLRLNSGF